jgi:radical SAM protein with 4Fe4S-binding SPASM domain
MRLLGSRTGRPHQRLTDSYLRYALKELKFLRSFDDLRAFAQKATYLMPRVIGTLNHFERVPPTLHIEPTNHCNVNCICCPSSRSSRQRGYMDLALFQRIIDEGAQIGIKLVRLFLHGEPMLHPQIVDMVRYMKAKGLGFHLVTNGMLFSRDRSEAILRSGVTRADHVMFSILGYSKDVHERVMRGVDHDRVERNLLELLALRKELGTNSPVITTVFYAMPENVREEEQYVQHWRGVVDHARLGGKISESWAEYKRDGKTRTPRQRTCFMLWDRMTIFWNGDVTICGEDVDGELVYGNLNNSSIYELWHSEPLSAIKQIHKEKRFEEIPQCSNCDL